MLTAFADDDAVIGAVLAGASGYLLKQARGQQVVQAIEAAAAGHSLLDPEATDRLVRHFRALAQGQEEREHLTEQERRVLDLIADGKTNREIAQALDLAEKTVKNYVSNILAKLQVRRRTDAAVVVTRHRARGTEWPGGPSR